MDNSGNLSKKVQKLLDEGKQVTIEDIIGDKFEPQGTVLLNKKMKYTEVIMYDLDPHTKTKVPSGNQKLFEGKIFTVVGLTPTLDYLILWDNGGTPDHATINKRDVEFYSPIKTEDGIIIPINLPPLEEMTYISRAKENSNHNKEIADLLASKKYEGDELFKVLKNKYKL